MGITKDSIESLKLKAKISDFILTSTTGKIRGNKGMAICPFHGEKTASMSFTDEENLFHCFGCKEGGDIFKYVQLINNIEFQESVEMVAEKYSFNLKYTDSQFESNQKSLIQTMKVISDYFKNNIQETSSVKPKKYLSSRKIENSLIKQFNLGFAELDEKIFSLKVNDLEPFGPVIVKLASSIFTEDSFGMVIFFFPIFDIKIPYKLFLHLYYFFLLQYQT